MMSESSPHLNQQSSQDTSLMISFNGELTGFKPWVFRPKRVIYSLDDTPPTKKQYSTSHWNEAQNQKYVQFLLKFREVVEGERKKRRKWHLNRIMSKFIGTRSHEQCRSHHQKMIKNYHSVQGILEHLNPIVEPKMKLPTPQAPSLTLPFEYAEPLPDFEESVFKLLQNPWELDSSFIRVPFFYREQSNDLF